MVSTRLHAFQRLSSPQFNAFQHTRTAVSAVANAAVHLGNPGTTNQMHGGLQRPRGSFSFSGIPGVQTFGETACKESPAHREGLKSNQVRQDRRSVPLHRGEPTNVEKIFFQAGKTFAAFRDLTDLSARWPQNFSETFGLKCEPRTSEENLDSP